MHLHGREILLVTREQQKAQIFNRAARQHVACPAEA